MFLFGGRRMGDGVQTARTHREIRANIADDEPLVRRGIRQLLSGHRDVTVVAETRNGPETLTALREHSPDLVFLAVQMPDLDGFGVLREYGPARMPAVIFVTAFERMRLHLRSSAALRMSDKLSALLPMYEPPCQSV